MSYQQLPQQEKCTGHMERYVCIILLSIQGFRAPDGRKSPLPIDLRYRPCNNISCWTCYIVISWYKFCLIVLHIFSTKNILSILTINGIEYRLLQREVNS